MALHRTGLARLAALFATIVVGSLVIAPGSASAAALGCADDASGVTDHSASWEAQLLQLTNEHRTGMGLVALQLDTTLTRASVWKARDMARRNYFAHEDASDSAAGAPSRTPWDRLAACGWTTGGSRAENIAASYSTAQQVITGWLNSPGHRANIENAAMRYVGFGVANGASSAYGTYSVQMFASVAGPSTTTPITVTPGTTTGTGTGSGPGTDTGAGDPTRDPYGLGDDGDAGTSPATAIADPLVRVTRSRCRSAQAVRGWCWRIVVRGRVSSAQAGQRTVVVTRRSASGQLVRVASLKSSSTGTFWGTAAIRPPARDAASWLARNTRSFRIAVARTTTASGTARTITARIASPA